MNYRHLVQGWLYSMFPMDGYGKFMHDEGYSAGNRKFKLFVFSDLIGPYKVQENKICFTSGCTLHIASQSEEFIHHLYRFIQKNSLAMIGCAKLEVASMQLSELPYFRDTKTVTIRTQSPVTAYTTLDKRVTYYNPEEPEFENACLNNIERKIEAYSLGFAPLFRIRKVISSKKRHMKFKNTFYIAYACTLQIEVDYATLALIWNTGLSAKNSAGFGMIEMLTFDNE